MKLDQNSSIPLYEQLKNDIKRDIKEGVFPAGSRMPSEDELGEKYSVSRITVRRAVKELCDEDYLIKKQGKGTFVLDNASIPVTVSQGFHDVWEKKGKKDTRIGQLIIIPVIIADFVLDLGRTRGTGAFGSTGK